VIAVDDQSNYPAAAPRTKLDGYTPNAEAVAGYRPDLVVVSSAANHVLAALGALHIPVLLDTPATTLAGAYAQIRQLGAATGHVRAAEALVARMRAQITSIVASTPRPATPLTVYEELSPDYYSAVSSTFIGQVYTMLGLRDIADEANPTHIGYPQLSGEYIISANPALIVLADTKCCHQSAATTKARPGWSTISAVEDGGVVAVNDDIASRWGPRIVDFIRIVAERAKALARAKHP
jgi:iron complex transport system substrate-binding protein